MPDRHWCSLARSVVLSRTIGRGSKSQILNAGWLLEQGTAATLEKSGFHVATAKAFPDPDDPSVSREIDVHAYRQIFRSDELSLSVGVRVIAECKQSSMPYVVVGAPANAYELERPRQEQHFRFPSIETGRTELGDGRARLHHTQAREYLGLDTLPETPWESGFVGSQMTRLDRKKHGSPIIAASSLRSFTRWLRPSPISGHNRTEVRT